MNIKRQFDDLPPEIQATVLIGVISIIFFLSIPALVLLAIIL